MQQNPQRLHSEEALLRLFFFAGNLLLIDQIRYRTYLVILTKIQLQDGIIMKKRLYAPLLALLLSVVLIPALATATELENLNPWQATAILKESPGLTILDVRTPEEFLAGHVQDAENLDFYNKEFKSWIDELDKEKPYFIYCRTGRRSGLTVDYMQQTGFKQIYHLKDGIRGWQGAGLPVVQ